MTNPTRTAYTRVHLIEGRARPDHLPSYESCMRMQGISRGFGDIETIECPDPYNYGKFISVGEVRGATERPTTTLEGRYAIDIKSTMLDLANKECSFDVHLHMGECEDPSIFNSFKKALVLEDAYITSFDTEDLGALESGDNAPVNETVDISAKEIYEVLPIAYGVKAGSILTNEVVDVVICDNPSCGECQTESDGCKSIFAITKAAGGSPSTPADVVFSIDKGVTWYAHDIESLGIAEDPTAVGCLGLYIGVTSNDAGSLQYALLSEFDGVTDPAFTEVTTGFVAGGEPNDIFSIGGIAYIVGDNGYVYTSEDLTAGVTAVDAGVATVDNLLAVHAFSEDFAVAVGVNGAVVYTENGTNWSAATSPVGVGVTLNCVHAKSTTEWFVGASNGNLYYTLDAGTTWTAKAFPGSGSGTVLAIEFSTPSIAWLAHQTAATRGRILRSYDGGYSWIVTPEASGTLTANDSINALAACSYDPNFIVGGGLADDAADGFLVVGA